MCGICGIYNYGSGKPVGPDPIEDMLQSMTHRGPDDRGLLVDGPIGIGMCRLSIIDLDGGHQPMSSEDGSLHIVFNGEIYNYVELRGFLIKKGHQLRTQGDTETILHLYEEYKENCLSYLRGMFAFCIWDQKSGHIFAARDRMGIKPLYYTDNAKRMGFASEIKTLLRMNDIPRDIDPNALNQFLSFRYIPAPLTVLSSIKKLPAGHYLTCSAANGIRIKEYWDLEFTDGRHGSEQAILQKLRGIMEEATRIRLRADVPLGVFLSGGLDSSYIAASISRMASEPVKTFSVGFEDREFNEFQYSRLAAKTLGTDHHELMLEPVRFADFFSKFVWFQDEPLADPAGIPLYFISKWAREKVTVVLSGEGADEVFAGYPRYNDAWRQIAVGQIYADMFPSSIRHRILEPLFGCIPGIDSYIKKYGGLADSPSDYYLLFSLIFSEFQKQRLYTRDMAAAVNGEQIASIFRDLYHKPRGADPLQRMLYVDWKTWLPEDLLMKADKMTMATSLELRVPFLDHQFVQFAASIPSNCKLRSGTPKHILKELARPLLPAEIVDRPKVGFPVPIRPWFRTELKTFAREILCDGQTAARGYFDPAAVDSLLKEHEQYHADHSHKIFNLLCFEQWCRLFLDAPRVHV